MFCYTDQVQSGHGLLLMTSCNYRHYCKEKINIRQVVKYNTKLCNGSCFIDVMCICCSYRSTVTQWVPLVEQDLRSLPENLSSPRLFDRSLVFCVIYILATVTSVVVRFTTSDYPLGNLTFVNYIHLYLAILYSDMELLWIAPWNRQ